MVHGLLKEIILLHQKNVMMQLKVIFVFLKEQKNILMDIFKFIVMTANGDLILFKKDFIHMQMVLNRIIQYMNDIYFF